MGPIGAVRERVTTAPRGPYPFVVRVSDEHGLVVDASISSFCMRVLR